MSSDKKLDAYMEAKDEALVSVGKSLFEMDMKDELRVEEIKGIMKEEKQQLQGIRREKKEADGQFGVYSKISKALKIACGIAFVVGIGVNEVLGVFVLTLVAAIVLGKMTKTSKKKLVAATKKEEEIAAEIENGVMFMAAGRRAYELHQKGQFSHDQLNEYFYKIKSIESSIINHKQEVKEGLNRAFKIKEEQYAEEICSCGAKLTKNAKFCLACGKSVSETSVCSCGAKLEKGARFCVSCGKSASGEAPRNELHQHEEPPQDNNRTYKECFCGAKLEETDTMCMECGREVTA